MKFFHPWTDHISMYLYAYTVLALNYKVLYLAYWKKESITSSIFLTQFTLVINNFAISHSGHSEINKITFQISTLNSGTVKRAGKSFLQGQKGTGVPDCDFFDQISFYLIVGNARGRGALKMLKTLWQVNILDWSIHRII